MCKYCEFSLEVRLAMAVRGVACHVGVCTKQKTYTTVNNNG